MQVFAVVVTLRERTVEWEADRFSKFRLVLKKAPFSWLTPASSLQAYFIAPYSEKENNNLCALTRGRQYLIRPRSSLGAWFGAVVQKSPSSNRWLTLGSLNTDELKYLFCNWCTTYVRRGPYLWQNTIRALSREVFPSNDFAGQSLMHVWVRKHSRSSRDDLEHSDELCKLPRKNVRRSYIACPLRDWKALSLVPSDQRPFHFFSFLAFDPSLACVKGPFQLRGSCSGILIEWLLYILGSQMGLKSAFSFERDPYILTASDSSDSNSSFLTPRRKSYFLT